MIELIHYVSITCGIAFLAIFLLALAFAIVSSLVSFLVEAVPAFKQAFDKFKHELGE